MARFTGRSYDIVSLPGKPIPEGYKIWVLACDGYILGWLFHTKYKSLGPIEVDTKWIKKPYSISKTEAVVVTLLSQFRGYGDYNYIVWLDNLFTSTRLLVILRDNLGYGAGGTVRYAATTPAGVNARGFDMTLYDLKKHFTDSIDWGELYAVVQEEDNILQFAWKDQGLVLFMTTAVEGTEEVIRERRRPAETATGAIKSRIVFGSEARKHLPIPKAIDLYNHHMNGVDQADQLRSYYFTQRIHRKGWKALWSFLLDVTVVNCYKLSVYGHKDEPRRRRTRQKDFRKGLIMGLIKLGDSLMPRTRHTTADLGDSICMLSPSRHSLVPGGTLITCRGCKELGNTGPSSSTRKPLGELSSNIRQGERRKRPTRTTFQCDVCRIGLCRSTACWDLHIDRVVAKRQRFI